MEKTTRPASTAERLREALQISGKKQADIVRETGLDKGAVSSYLSGKYEPKKRAIALLAQALGVSEMWLWGYDVPMFRTEAQKKNDQLARLLVKMREDPGFFDLVSSLSDLSPEQYASITQLVSAFGKNAQD